MEVQQDFKELLQLFNAHKVEYVIVESNHFPEDPKKICLKIGYSA